MKNAKIKVLCILPTLGHPRHVKRINMLQETGCNVEVLSFERDYHKGLLPNCNIELLGKIKHRHYKQRIFKLLKAIPKVRKKIRQNNIVYTFGSDNALLTIIAGLNLKVPVFLEIGDIFRIQIAKGFKGYIYRFFEKLFLKKIRFLITTSQSYLDIYYKQWVKSNINGMVIENKLEATFVQNTDLKRNEIISENKPLIDRPLRIGYFGVLRDAWSIEVLRKLAEKFLSDYEIIIAGKRIDTINLPKQTNNFIIKGEYKFPDDLPGLYQSVDMVWACFPPNIAGSIVGRWARTNRFYEACCFGKPIFTLSEGQDAVAVNQFNIGTLVKDSTIDIVIEKIREIEFDDFCKWKKNLNNLPISIYSYTNENQLLFEEIKKHVK